MGLLTNKIAVALPEILRSVKQQKPGHILSDLSCFLPHRQAIKRTATRLGEKQLTILFVNNSIAKNLIQSRTITKK